MEEIAVCIGEKVAEILAGPILRRARYLFRFKQFVGDVEKAKQQLEGKLADVNKRKEEADRKTEEIMPSVKKWLDDVNAIFEDVQKLQELEGRGNKCFNVSLRYSLARQMEDKAKQMIELKNNSYFEPFSQLIQLPGIGYFSSKDFVDFNSRKSAYNRLLEAIKDRKNKMVGLYGMGGSGKTTLAKEIGKKVDEFKLFEKVVMAVVSKPLDILKIQQEIAGQIGLQLLEIDPLSRAQRLSLGLKNKRILIILDDVWSKLSLEQIGIPLNEVCCVFLTTRRHDVCLDMNCESIIELTILTDEEAWDLFKMHANPSNVSKNEFDSIGRKIVDECKGLPIAIVTLGSTLKRRGVRVWESTLQKLQRPLPLDLEDDDFKKPFAILEVSYDNLPSPLAQSLFLLCSMFPEDHEIHIEDLIRFGKGTFKLGDNIYTMEDARKEILRTIEKLLDSCLLMHTNKQACVKMHDLVRDVALWITKKQHQAILVDKLVVSRTLDENETLKETKAISLWNLENNFKLSNQLHCATLEILLLHSTEAFIEDLGGIESLKVLALVTSSFKWGYYGRQVRWSMPQSLVSSLMNLHSLCFRGIVLGDISFLCQLKRLEILDLRGSQFDKLSGEIVDMKKLKILDVFECEIKESPFEVIQKCEQLEELYFREKKSAIPKNFSLSRLERFVIYDSTSEIDFFDDLPSQVFDSCDEPLRVLCIQGFKVSNSSMKDLILRANSLRLENCIWDHKDINVNIKHLMALKCLEKRFIVESLDTDVLQTRPTFPHLITLTLGQMDSLEQVFPDSSIICSLPMLQELYVKRCPQLTTIFTTIISLPKLSILGIHGCNKLKWLFSYSLALHCPSLVELTIKECYELERLIEEEVAHGDRPLHQRESHHDLPNYPFGNETEKITVRDCFELENLDKEASHEDILVLFLKLKHLTLWNLPKLREIFGGRFKQKLESLHNKQEYSPHKHKNERVKVVNLELISINLQGLPKWECIWQGPTQFMSLQRLKEVVLIQCSRLKHVFTLAIVTSLPKLRRLGVQECEEWEGIFCEESLKNLTSSIVCLPRLDEIDIYDCHKVRRLFSYALASHCPSLEKIAIVNCSQLEGVVQAYEGEVASHHEKLFPKLNDLDLKRLPKLREIYPAGYEFNHLSGITHTWSSNKKVKQTRP